MTQGRVILLTFATVVFCGLGSISPPAPAAADGRRCCFYISADSQAEAVENFTGDTVHGEQQANVAWALAGIFEYQERGGFSDLRNRGPVHEHSILYMKDEILTESVRAPAGEPVAEPGTCGTFKKKRAERFPRLDIFRGQVSVQVRNQSDRGCLYGLSVLTWDTSERPEHYAPWAEEYKAPPRAFFRSGRGVYRRQTGFQSTYSPQAPYGIASRYDHTGFLKVEWFPPHMLDRRLERLRDYHSGYDFQDACSQVPC